MPRLKRFLRRPDVTCLLTKKQRSHTNIEEEYIRQNSGAKPETFPLLRSESNTLDDSLFVALSVSYSDPRLRKLTTKS
ncbi:hypothetical protein [Nostoc sp. 'Peltigera malacea cyanobiont' DB3992]|uniref:hypothetical protein n=1 Tax=Nostoc sp. 'Peltigera malacea cyanobiont' DB3992 TaxID=1206980 RepID=UPI0011816240|nr:hypothetical protein [Nostoc sp. 'Peltigera malacea cyanobiont' DB3992]